MLENQILPYLIIVLYTVKLCVWLNRALREGQLHTENCARWIVASLFKISWIRRWRIIILQMCQYLLTVTLTQCGHYLTSMLRLSHVS